MILRRIRRRGSTNDLALLRWRRTQFSGRGCRLLGYVVKRTMALIPVFIGITLLTFVLSRVVPVDPARLYAGDSAPQATVDALRAKMGLDKPLWDQYGIYLKGLLKGDLGTSLLTGRPVASEIKKYFPATFELATFAVILALIIGIPVGIISAVRRNSALDHATRITALAGVCTPVFWLGLILILIFYGKLGIFPARGRLDLGMIPPSRITGLYLVDSLLEGNFSVFVNALWHLLLPGITLAYGAGGQILRLVRSSMLEVLGEDFVRTARSKGLSERVVIYRHALRNALLPTLTMLGIIYGSLLGGAVLTETIFSWPGLGRYAVTAMTSFDFPSIMGFALFAAVAYSVVNLVVDLLYGRVDPRVSLK